MEFIQWLIKAHTHTPKRKPIKTYSENSLWEQIFGATHKPVYHKGDISIITAAMFSKQIHSTIC